MIRPIAALAALVLALLAPAPLFACACGCDVFEVSATPTLMATRGGGMAWLEWDYLNQNQNHNRYSKADNAANGDKHIQTSFFTLGAQRMVADKWGVSAELPYDYRYRAVSPDGQNVQEIKHGAVGDIRLRGVYTGLSADMTTGLTFGLKLPTGEYSNPDFDRDTQLGTGSTDLLAGGYHLGEFSSASDLRWFVNAQLDQPVFVSGGYRPGAELGAGLGVSLAPLQAGAVSVAPIAQALVSHRWRDSGIHADAPNTGYDRLALGPGVELGYGPYRVYGSAAFPVYQYTHGNQLVSPALYSVTFGYTF